MPYIDRFKSVFKYISQPTAIAILGSVGVHAALGALLPTLPIFPQEAPIRRNVRVVELSPGQAQRLPNLDPPPPMPFAGLPNSTQFLPFDSPDLGNRDLFTPPEDTRSIPLLPSRPDPSLDATAQNSPSVTPPSRVQFRSGLPNTTPSNPSNEQIRRQLAALEAVRRNRALNGNAGAGLPTPGGTQFQVRDDLSAAEVLRRSLQQSTAESTEEEAAIDAPLHDGNSPMILSRRDRPSEENTTAENPENPETTTNTAQNPQERIREHQAQIARIQQERDRNNTEGANSETTGSPLAWSQAIQQSAIQRQSITGQYPQAACPSQAQGTTVYGVVVDADGRIANLRPLQSAGNPILDQAAQSQVGNANLAPNGAPTPYYVAVNFRYNSEVCTAQTPAPPETTQPENNNNTPAQPTPENNERPPARPQPTPENNERPPARPQPTPENNERPPARPQPTP
ncbi:MAG: TonB family protein, partial [Spirulinaceae cyanobacterium]